MTKKEKKVVNEVCQKLNNIYNYHNKNLTQDQYFKLMDCLDLLESIGIKML